MVHMNLQWMPVKLICWATYFRGIVLIKKLNTAKQVALFPSVFTTAYC
jgi:hypothetical protein